MNEQTTEAALKARIEHHRAMAESYHRAYLERTVEAGVDPDRV